ncbi:DUF6585 family protein [Streptomyces chartreusis]|uniref:DUF6585 family protein n=1 Tax=Streptomyces chartreusis TaxID=1969 RepID=UPI004063BCEC
MSDGTGRGWDRDRERDRAADGTDRDRAADGADRDRAADGTKRDRAGGGEPDRAGGGEPDRAGGGERDQPPWDPALTRADALLLARVSEAAGRARLGRRQTTYGPPLAEPGRRWAGLAGARRLLRGDRERTGTGPIDRLDLYERGLTVAVDGRIHVVRYDTTVVRRRRALSSQGLTRAHVLVDLDGERIVLRCRDFGEPEAWGPEIHRSVADAQVPRALAALTRGERLDFGPVWLTRAELGSRGTTLRWAQVQRIEILKGSVAVRTAGRWQVWGSVTSGIPNLCVLRTLAEYLTAAERDED